jgi:hypothetical protein
MEQFNWKRGESTSIGDASSLAIRVACEASAAVAPKSAHTRKRYLSALLLASTCLVSAAALGESGNQLPLPTPLVEAPCVINKVERDRANAAGAAARALADRKAAELVDPENGADRANTRLKDGHAVTWEGGSSHHRLSLDLSTVTIRNETKSFDFVEVYTGQLKTKVPRLESCMWKMDLPFGGKIETKGTCLRDSWLITDVPMLRNKHVEFSLPSKVEIGHQTQEFSYDLPTVTERDNRRDFEHAKADVERIKRELDAGKAAIAETQTALLYEDIKEALDGIEKDTLATFDRNVASQKAMFAQKRSELIATRDQARAAYAAAKDPHGADAAFAQAFALLDKAEAEAKASSARERQQITEKIAEMRKDYLTDHKDASCPANPAKTEKQS